MGWQKAVCMTTLSKTIRHVLYYFTTDGLSLNEATSDTKIAKNSVIY